LSILGPKEPAFEAKRAQNGHFRNGYSNSENALGRCRPGLAFGFWVDIFLFRRENWLYP
jgi:hypothetical protein